MRCKYYHSFEKNDPPDNVFLALWVLSRVRWKIPNARVLRDVDLKYKLSSEMYLGDTISRAFLRNTIQSKAEEEAGTIHATDFLSISESQLREVQAETAQDDTLQQLKKTIVSEWPDTKNEVLTYPHPYFLVRDELSAQDGLQRSALYHPLEHAHKD